MRCTMIARPPIKFTLSGTPVSRSTLEAASAADPAVRSSSPRSSSPHPAAGARLEPTVVEVLPSELIVQSLQGDALAEAAKTGGLFACLRSEASDSAAPSFTAIFDAALAPEGANGKEPRRTAALRIKRRDDSRAQPGEALAALQQLLADSGLKPFPLAAGDQELILVDHTRARVAAHTLIGAGHAVGPPLQITPPPDAKDGLKAELAEKFCGAWRLVQRQRPPSAVVQKFGRGDGPLRIVAPSGVYVEVNIQNPGEVVGQASSCGLLSVENTDGQLILVRHSAVSFEPPIGGARSSSVVLDPSGGEDGEDVAVETLIDDARGSEIDRWERIGSGEVTVLELASVDSKSLSSGSHAGYWLFCSGFWARITGLPHGTGLVAGRCCRSLEAAQDLYGEERVAEELRAQFSASCGVIEKPGLLSMLRQSWSSKDGALYDAGRARDEVRKEGDVIVHAPGDGVTTTWDVRAFAMDPFTPVAKRSSKPSAPKGLRKKDGSDSDEDSEASKDSDDSSASKKKEEAKEKKKDDSDSDSAASKSSSKKDKEKEKEKEKRSKSSSSDSSKAKKKNEKDRSRSRDKKKSRDRSRDKKDKSRDRSRGDKKKSRSRNRDRDRSRDRDRKDKSRDRDRDRRDKDRDRKDRSRSRDKKDRDRDRRDKRSRSRDRDRDRRDKDRSRDRDRDKKRSRSRDRKDRSRDKKDKDRRDRSRDKRKKDRSRSRSKDKKDRSRSRDKKKKDDDKKKDKDDVKKKDKGKDKAKSSSDSESNEKKKAKKSDSSDDSSNDGDAKKKGKGDKADAKKSKKKDGSDDSSSEEAKKSDASDSDSKKKDATDKKDKDQKKSEGSDSEKEEKADKKTDASETKSKAGEKPSEVVKDSDDSDSS